MLGTKGVIPGPAPGEETAVGGGVFIDSKAIFVDDPRTSGVGGRLRAECDPGIVA